MKELRSIAEPIVVQDRQLVEGLIQIPLEAVGRVEFRAGASSRSRVLLDFDSALLEMTGLSAAPTNVPQSRDCGHEKENTVECDFFLEPGACVDVFHILEGNAPASLSVKIRYHLKKHATLNAWLYVGMDDFSCFEQDVFFREEHGFASLRGLSIVGQNAQVYHKVKAEHLVGHCISRQFFKSITAGQSKSGFESLVSVSKGAAKSDSKQLNKNLILSRTSQAYSRPELRIHTDDVSCAHGSATGELSADELFYLRSRGIALDQARFMMIAGFAAEAIQEVSSEALKIRLEQLIGNKIEKLMQELPLRQA